MIFFYIQTDAELDNNSESFSVIQQKHKIWAAKLQFKNIYVT